ncbi:MAG: hypothetical protein KAU28_04760, partial [Phycisphaerae bacterium]|nr:hypothetical protein [Phycisphaerae bacterium]
MRIERYDPGAVLTYKVRGVLPARSACVRLEIERFVGGGFAGQVYRVKVIEIEAPDGPLAGLAVGGSYAMKILVPPSNRARAFRDAIYKVGFQAPFSLQSNPAAGRAGALWQKFIRRGAGIRLGSERAVVDILATFVDETIGSCGEISEWVDGRTWRFEVNDRLDVLKQWCRGGDVDAERAGSPEYRAKKVFMAEMVRLFHEMGAPELARQYEWWTCKSQPNVLKRRDAGDDPAAGLIAVDFRAGLALLPFLPMSPGDVPLIFKGVARGSLVQFDRGNIAKLQQFIDAHPQDFADMGEALAELKAAERQYRDSQIDITHNHVRLLSPRRWGAILDGEVTACAVRNIADEKCTAHLRRSGLLAILFVAMGLVPLAGLAAAVTILCVTWARGGWSAAAVGLMLVLALAPPAATRFVRRVWGRADYRRHYRQLLTSAGYFLRAVRAKIAEWLISWHGAGRVSAERALSLMASPCRFLLHLPLSLLPAGLHRFCSDHAFRAEKLRYIFVRPVRLYFNAEAREQWLRDMVAEGQKHHMLSDEDAEQIRSKIKEPFIQKYLQSLAVHVCTL